MPLAVVDTDVLSFMAKADTRASLYEAEMADRSLCVCFQTVAELRLWVRIRGWGPSRQVELDELLAQFIVLPYDAAMAQHWAEITACRRHMGKPIECGDAWIAASALRHGAVLLTHNGRHYADIPGLHVVSYPS